MTSGRSQMLATRNFGDWHVLVNEVPLFYALEGIVVQQLGHWTCNQDVVMGLTSSMALLCNNLRHAVHMLVPLSPSRVIW